MFKFSFSFAFAFILIFGCLFVDANDHPFIKFIAGNEATIEDLITAEMLLESVEWDYVDGFYDLQEISETNRKDKTYKPQFTKERIKKALPFLIKKEWLSFQVLGDRPISSIKVLKFFPNIKRLVLMGNPIDDLSPISSLINLEYLNLSNCQVESIRAFEPLVHLKELYLGGNKIKSYQILENCISLEELYIREDVDEKLHFLEKTKKLKILSINGALIDNLNGVEPLESLEKLNIDYKRSYPILEMTLMHLPECRNLASLRIEGPKMESLKGISKFKNLKNLDLDILFTENLNELSTCRELEFFEFNTAGLVPSLDVLRNLKKLKYIDCQGQFNFSESSFQNLKNLRHIEIRDSKGKKHLFKDLKVSWSAEFLVKQRVEPSKKVKVITQEQFNYYDENPFNYNEKADGKIHDFEGEWLIERILKNLKKFSKEDEYEIPYNYDFRRSQTLVVNDEESIKNYSKIIDAIQSALTTTKKDWIIYLHVDSGEDLPVWVYGDHLEMTKGTYSQIKKYLQKK